MMNAKLLLARTCACGLLAACGLLVACSDYSSGQQNSPSDLQSQNESGEATDSGSATDIVSSDGTEVSTNNLNDADNGIGGPTQRANGNYQSPSVPGQSSDQELAKQIKIALTTGSMGTTGVIAENQLTKIDVQVQNGTVTLTGAVGSDDEKRTIQKQVSGMKGVQSVNNQLTVQPGATARNPTDSPLPRTQGNQ
ncbi:MAG: BON domain-containing protein, partial [Limisphaerales bacterium]